MKKSLSIGGVLLLFALITWALVARHDPSAHHFREFADLQTNYNAYRPSWSDRLKGIDGAQAKWDFHLRRLMELGAVRHEEFVFSEIPYTRESSKRLWLAVHSNFPRAVMVTAPHRDTNSAGYGVEPYVLKVWDVPGEMPRWSSFFETHNRAE
jgi:hypothetical protein